MVESHFLLTLPDSIGLLEIGPSFLLKLPDTVLTQRRILTFHRTL